MNYTKKMHEYLREEAARACWLARRFKGDGTLEQWYDGRYTAYKQSAALLQIAIEHDEWRAEHES